MKRQKRTTLNKLIIIYVGLFIVFIFSSISHASYECSLVRQLSDQLRCGMLDGAPGAEREQIPDPNFVLSSDFGPTLCKAKQVIEEPRKDLKKECDTWLKERKTDLGKSFLTGTCQESQEACSGGLVRLTYKGLVHYSKPAVTK